MHVSYMALEICDGVTKAAWNVSSYRRYWKLLNKELERLNGIYADLERARDHIGKPIREIEE
jgi:hypothetical protein